MELLDPAAGYTEFNRDNRSELLEEVVDEPVDPSSAEIPELLVSVVLPENNWPIVLATLASMVCTSCSA